MRNFRDYDVWNKSIPFIKKIYVATAEFPGSEKFGIISQIQRASVSISSNIAEGCSRSSEKDFARFIEIAIGSSFEAESLLIVSSELGFITSEKLNELIPELEVIQKQLNTLRSRLSR